MKIGYIGLGKMGFGMVERLLERGHEVVANNRSKEAIDRIHEKGAEKAYDLKELVDKTTSPRTIWIMVPHKAVDDVLEELVPLLSRGDTVIDGGNTPYTDTIRRSKELSEKGILFMDAGVSGGPGGARNGACMMIGGDEILFNNLNSIFRDLCVQDGFQYVGGHGAGHYVKMVHNGIEYGMMQAIGEGFNLMKKSSEFNFDMKKIADVYNHGSVIESKLVGWLGKAYQENGNDLVGISGEVSHSGEGQWTVETAKREGQDVTNIEQSLQFRIKSQGNPSYTGQVVSALRNQFGGHDVKS